MTWFKHTTSPPRPNRHGVIGSLWMLFALVGLWHNWWMVGFGVLNASIWLATEKLAGK